MFRQTLYGDNTGSSYGSSKPSMIKQSFQNHSAHPLPMFSDPLGSRSSNGAVGSAQSLNRPAGLTFTNSPFYTILESLTPTKDLPEVMHQCRNTVQMQFTLNAEQVNRFKNEPNLRILLYCTADINTGFFARPPEIGFPTQVELRVNDEHFTGNLRGIKKKPGTTRPADITGLVRKNVPGHTNIISITYAATEKFNFEQLVVDQYVQEILRTTSKSVEQVTIEPNGDWKPGSNTNDDFRSSTNSSKAKMPFVSSSDDLVEIQDFRPHGSKSGQSSTPQSFMKSPNLSSREASTAASTAPRSTPSKRAQDNVIDLTLDSDEDEVPEPPKKRQSFGSPLQNVQSPFGLPATNQSSTGYSFGVPAYQHNFQPPNNPSPFGRGFWSS
ncbi:MAG: SUMO ligase siz1 [Alyxoria varia]|nr:MAG: SUMO ligase siz1 [Alyxoria varia]